MYSQQFPSIRSSARPSSSQSLPAYPSGQQAIPAYINRRPATARALRSSPLAGPLSNDEVTEDGKKPRYRPSRISSTPDLAAVTVARARYASMANPTNFKLASPHPLESLSAYSTKNTESSQRRPTMSFSSSSTATQSSPYRHGSDYSPFPWEDVKPPVMPNNRPPSRNPRENWPSITDSTPRFSRHDLDTQGIVMPVSARSKSQPRGSSASINSRTSTVLPRNDSRSSLCIQVDALPAFAGPDFGVLSGALDGKRMIGENRISILSVDERRERLESKRPFVMRITGMAKKDPVSPTKKIKNWSAVGDEIARQTGWPVEQKKVGGFRRRWNDIIASVRR